MNISGFTTDNSVSTGPVAQSDFREHGRIELVFHVNEKFGVIGLSIAGFLTSRTYYLKPNKKQELINAEFYSRYVENFNNKEKIDAIIK